jgi:hypothetical protein
MMWPACDRADASTLINRDFQVPLMKRVKPMLKELTGASFQVPKRKGE